MHTILIIEDERVFLTLARVNMDPVTHVRELQTLRSLGVQV